MKIRNILRRTLVKVLSQIDSTPPMSHPVSNRIRSDSPGEFYLDETAQLEITGTTKGIDLTRWMQIAHCEDKRTALVLISGESVKLTGTINIERDTMLFMRYSAALPDISADGLICEVCFQGLEQEQPADLICTLPVSGGKQTPYWRVIELDISFLVHREGCLLLRCGPGPAGDPSSDWLAISDLSIARVDRLSILKARSFHELRTRNEIEHFSGVYRHSMYSTVQNHRAEIAAGESRPVRKLVGGSDFVQSIDPSLIDGDVVPLSGESPYGYASRLLASSIPQQPPNFAMRLKSRAEGGIVKVLSICSGASRFEASYAAQVGTNVEWSLLDINVDLLGLACKQFSSTVKLDLIEANVNELEYSGEKWDVILCISALHHVVELESVIKFCHGSLNEGGEFWSIGEYVGRNGNRLWPEARDEANKIFYQLPEKYRLNRHTNQIDTKIPDNDYSVGCFEGIRSEEIESVLDRWFHCDDVYRRNCFLWRLINLAYSDNYSLLESDDRKLIISMVNAEVAHFQSGGRCTELFGVFRPRLMRNLSKAL